MLDNEGFDSKCAKFLPTKCVTHHLAANTSPASQAENVNTKKHPRIISHK